jgi:hypothetical protein
MYVGIMNKVIDTFLNGKLPSWVHKDERAYKKGGKVKKDKKPRKPKTPSISQKVNVNVKIGDSVLLRKGNVPRRGNPGVAKRFLSHGSAFGGGLPGPLNSSSYGSAPQVAMPLGRMDFISSSDAYFNRNRDKRDDIPIEVNPSGIHADVSPSVRAVQNTKAVETPDSVLSSSRSSAGVKAMREAFANMPTAIFQGEIPRLGGAELAPSARAMASQPSTGFMNTKGSMIGAMPGGASSGGSLDDYRFQAQSAYDRPPELPLAELPGMSKDESAQPAVSKLKPVRVSMDKQYPPGSAQEKAQSTKTLMALIKSDYPSLKLLKAEGFDSYEDAFETYKSNMDHGLPGLKRGGRVHSAF